jgi:hypothetical protein
MMLATMLMALVRAGVPIVTGTALTCAIGLFRNKLITWEPSSSWAYTFLHRIGLNPGRGTQAARALPPDFDVIKRLYILRVV